MKSLNEQLEIIKRGTVKISELSELESKLKKNKPLRIKHGVDPTSADLHLGHSVPLRKLRQFQDLGHHVILLIGSYTAQVGDPSGRNKTRPQLTEEEVIKHAEHYLEQAGKILDLSKLEVRYNGEWFKKMNFMDVIRLLAKTTVARTLEREDFKARIDEKTPIYLHEIVYPLMQGYDSVMLECDVEVGGSDQTFNLMVGRDLQREADQEPQICLTLPILEGLDGTRKMSKSYGNYVGISEAPQVMFGKIMSISDELMWSYYELLTSIDLDKLKKMKTDVESGAFHPMEAKKQLACTIISNYYPEEEALAARAEFEKIFSQKEIPTDISEVKIGTEELDLAQFLFEQKICSSKSEARRMIQQGGVSVDGEKISTISYKLEKDFVILKAGKKSFIKIIK